MLPNWDVVADKYESLIDGRQTIEDADLWAANVRIACEFGSLQYDPKDDEAEFWEASQYLCGIDLMVAPGAIPLFTCTSEAGIHTPLETKGRLVPHSGYCVQRTPSHR